MATPVTHSALYRAPFAPGGPSAVDAALAEQAPRHRARRAAATTPTSSSSTGRRAASSSTRASSRAPRAASRWASACACRRATRPGYAYVERLDWDAMKRAAETAAQIASGGGSTTPVARAAARAPEPLRARDGHARRARARQARAPRARGGRGPRVRPAHRQGRGEPRRGDPRDPRRDERRHDGRATCSRSCASACAPSPRRTASGRRARAAAAGARASATSRARAPSGTRSEAARQAIAMLDAREAPAGQMEVVLAPGDSGILLHEAVGHGLEADFNRKGTSNYSGQIGETRRERRSAPWSTTRRSSRAAARSTSTTRATSRRAASLIEKGKLVGYMHDRLSAKHFELKPSGNGRRESFACAPMPRMTNTILLAGPHDPEEILKSVKRGRLRQASSAAARSTSPTATSSSRSPRATWSRTARSRRRSRA